MNHFIQNKLKINLRLKPLDWLIIFIFSVITVFFIITSSQKNKWITVKFKVTLPPHYFHYNGEPPPFWIVDKIKAGDIQYDAMGQKNLKILSISSIGYQDKMTWITASVKAKYLPKQKKYVFQSVPLEIGRSIDTTINGTNIHGMVTYIEGATDTRKMYDIKVKTITRGLDPWVVDVLKNGLTMTDSNGKIVAEIIDVVSKPAEKIVTTWDGRVLAAEEPVRKDVYMTLKLVVTRHDDDGKYYFLDDQPINISFSVAIYLKQLLIAPEIIQIL
jgi:hypothetical protein